MGNFYFTIIYSQEYIILTIKMSAKNSCLEFFKNPDECNKQDCVYSKKNKICYPPYIAKKLCDKNFKNNKKCEDFCKNVF